jgi:hypothetical protein
VNDELGGRTVVNLHVSADGLRGPAKTLALQQEARALADANALPRPEFLVREMAPCLRPGRNARSWSVGVAQSPLTVTDSGL